MQAICRKEEKMAKNSVKSPSIIDALAWHAMRTGTSYGKLSATLTSEAIQRIYAEYEEMVRNRQEEERIRIENAKSKKKNHQKR